MSRRSDEKREEEVFAQLMERMSASQGEQWAQLEEQGLPPLPPGTQQRLLAQMDALLSAKKKRPRWQKVLPKAAMAALLALVLSTTLLYTHVDAFRDKMRELVMDRREESIDFSTKQDGPDGPVDFGNIYAPTKIPKGFEIVESEKQSGIYMVEYWNKDGNYIRFSAFSEHSNVGTDSENAKTIKDVKINGNSGVAIDKDNIWTVAWHDAREGKFYVIYSDVLSEKQLLKIAKSVKIQK